MKKIAIFASGTGSNAVKIIEYFKNHKAITVSLIVSNKPDAGVIKIAEQFLIPTLILEKEKFFRGNAFTNELKEAGIDFIILAGFLWKITTTLIKVFADSIINIHPALLPNYGGKGMYGQYVHQAVIDNKETETGITIHFVDEHYDHGNIIFQARCAVQENDTALSLAHKVQQLEHEHYPLVIEKLLLK